jgi:hypothetical protein
MIDVFFIEYVHPGDDLEVIFGKDGVLDELWQWKESGWVRFVGATAHDRSVARRLAADPRVGVLMHRFNMAHRKAAQEVFPVAAKTRTPIVAFTATRWGTLLAGPPPTATGCYQYCLAQSSVNVVLTAPELLAELEQNSDVHELPLMGKLKRGRWQRFGHLVYGAGKGAFKNQLAVKLSCGTALEPCSLRSAPPRHATRLRQSSPVASTRADKTVFVACFGRTHLRKFASRGRARRSHRTNGHLEFGTSAFRI